MATLEGCRGAEKQLIRFVPEEELIPGIATWKPSVCTLCSAGCGLLVRVMQGEAEVVRHGQQGLIKMGLAKKLEGNPQHPVNQGKLCARGQAGLQVLYHPDRITHPIKRSGARGSGDFQPISWDDALKELASYLTALQASNPTTAVAFLSRPSERPARRIDRALPERLRCAAGDLVPAFRRGRAARGQSAQLWTLQAAHVRSCPRRLCHLFRRRFSWHLEFAGGAIHRVRRDAPGPAGRRAKFVQVESRMSQTGANADEWIACRPGTEGALALGIAHVILSEKLAPQGAGSRGGALIAGWSAGLPDHTPEAVEKQTGVSAAVIKRLAHELTQSASATAMIGGGPLARSNGLPTALAVNALESLVDTGHGSGPILSFMPELPMGESRVPMREGLSALHALVGAPPQLLLLYDANPVFSAPPALRSSRSHGKNSIHCQLWQLHGRDERSGRPDFARPRPTGVLARQHA